MTTSVLDSLEVLEQTDEKATAALVFLHGTGENGNETKDKFVKYLGASGHPYIRVYFPTAKTDYLKIRDTVEGNIEDANEVTDMIERIVSEIESTGIPRDRIAIGGSSQGGMVSMYAAYVRKINVAAVVGIAATNILLKKTEKLEGSKIPLLSLYGQNDAFIEPEWMAKLWKQMRANKIPFLPKTLINGGHYLNKEYVKIMFEWLEKIIPTQDES